MLLVRRAVGVFIRAHTIEVALVSLRGDVGFRLYRVIGFRV